MEALIFAAATAMEAITASSIPMVVSVTLMIATLSSFLGTIYMTARTLVSAGVLLTSLMAMTILQFLYTLPTEFYIILLVAAFMHFFAVGPSEYLSFFPEIKAHLDRYVQSSKYLVKILSSVNFPLNMNEDEDDCGDDEHVTTIKAMRAKVKQPRKQWRY